MSEENENIQFELTDELLEQVEQLIENQNDKELKRLLDDFHYADIAEILDANWSNRPECIPLC